jgi:dTDP-4-amino-4,6-dideoxygalactose transaminase
MGARWRGRPSGSFGVAACFSAQTYKHVNAGEGGLLTSDDPDLTARAIVLSGSYMHYDRHLAGPPPEAYARIRFETPNCSGRMDDLRAAILRPQLRALGDAAARWNARYRAVEAELAAGGALTVPARPPEEGFVGSSIQFLAARGDAAAARAFVAAATARGVEVKWFGDAEPRGYTSRHDSWRYLEPAVLPKTDAVLARLFDMRLPLTFSLEDCRLIGRILRRCAEATLV